jgi:hypothetical protein
MKTNIDIDYDFRVRDNAGRLASVLFDYADDYSRVERLAKILDYEPRQLQQDMKDIRKVVRSVPRDCWE